MSAAILLGAAGAARPDFGPQAQTQRIVSFNLDAGQPPSDATLAVLTALDADIVCVQEVSDAWADALRGRFGRDYPYQAFGEASSAYGGIGLLSRHPLREFRVLPACAGGWFAACAAVVELPDGAVEVLNVHLRPVVFDRGGLAGQVAAFFFAGVIHQREIRAHAAGLCPDRPRVVCGDFNEGPAGPALAYLRRCGFTEALTGQRPQSTWRGRMGRFPIAAHLDHVLLSDRLVCRDAWVCPGGRSDHDAVVVDVVRWRD